MSISKNAFMVAAIASVLVLGTGYSQMQSFGQNFDSLPGFDIASELRQSADCAGMLNDCGNDRSVNNPPTTPPGNCEECFDETYLNPTQLANLQFLLGLAKTAPVSDLCNLLDSLTEAELKAAILNIINS